MMRDVVLQIGEAEQQFKNLFARSGVEAAGVIRKSLHGMAGVGEKPIERLLVHRLGLQATSANLVGASDDELDEMIETNTLSG